MKKLLIAIALIPFLFFSCGSDGDGLTPDDINNISGALFGALNSIDYSGSQKINEYYYASTKVAINETHSCPVAGRISVAGNVVAVYNEDTGESSGSGQLTFYISDPTNNLNDCEVGNGIILDGEILLTMTYKDSVVSGVMEGTIGINKRGPTGGLQLLTSECRIFISFNSSTGSSGTICDRNVSS